MVERLGIRHGHLVCLMNPPENFYTALSRELPPGCRLQLGLPRQPTFAVIIYWPEGPQGLDPGLTWLKTRITEEGSIWVVVPRRGGNSLTPEAVRQAARQAGLVNDRQVNINGYTALHLALRRHGRR